MEEHYFGSPEGLCKATPIFVKKLIILLKVYIFSKFLLHRTYDPGKFFKTAENVFGSLRGVTGPRPFFVKKFKLFIFQNLLAQC